MAWTVVYTNKAAKQYMKLPQLVRDTIDLLVMEIRLSGPVRGNWKNYSKLEGRKNQHHCHVKSGKPTYVCHMGRIGQGSKAGGGHVCRYSRKSTLLKKWLKSVSGER